MTNSGHSLQPSAYTGSILWVNKKWLGQVWPQMQFCDDCHHSHHWFCSGKSAFSNIEHTHIVNPRLHRALGTGGPGLLIMIADLRSQVTDSLSPQGLSAAVGIALWEYSHGCKMRQMRGWETIKLLFLRKPLHVWVQSHDVSFCWASPRNGRLGQSTENDVLSFVTLKNIQVTQNLEPKWRVNV